MYGTVRAYTYLLLEESVANDVLREPEAQNTSNK